MEVVMVSRPHVYGSHSAARHCRTVAVIGRYAHRLLSTALALDDCEVVLLESTAHAYSKIKRSRPDVVVMCVTDDDVDGCRVLSMLALDRETATIPVLTYLTPDPGDGTGAPEDIADATICSSSIALN
jgi:CheY-like chemotaxis protein